MISNLIKISLVTTLLLIGWIVYELYLNKIDIQTSDEVNLIDSTINTDILNGLKAKYHFD